MLIPNQLIFTEMARRVSIGGYQNDEHASSSYQDMQRIHASGSSKTRFRMALFAVGIIGSVFFLSARSAAPTAVESVAVAEPVQASASAPRGLAVQEAVQEAVVATPDTVAAVVATPEKDTLASLTHESFYATQNSYDNMAACVDVPNWEDKDGFGCDGQPYDACNEDHWISREIEDGGSQYFESRAKADGVSARQACCRCGKPFDPPQYGPLPEAVDWRYFNGRNMLTPVLNQHIPQYCGSCWAHAATSVIGDRMKILRNAEWPDYQVSVQYLLNCGQHAAGTCEGGDVTGAFHVAKREGIPEFSCLQYKARDDYCTEFNTCRNCHGPAGAGNCSSVPVSSYSRYWVTHIVDITQPTVEQMMREVATYGPIATMIHSDNIMNYKGFDVIKLLTPLETDHVVCIVGYGTDPVEGDYWIVRNSWGTYWGNEGFFRIVRGKNALAIESEVAWAYPKVTWETKKPRY